MKNLKVSVLIANYNNEKYIPDCIESIKNQTYKNIEIIFHDDCSTDNSLKVINKYKNIKIIKNKIRSNHGAFNQINAYQKAFNISKGKIIFLLDKLFNLLNFKTIGIITGLILWELDEKSLCAT